MASTTYDGYRITELRRYATEYAIAGRSKMTGDELLVAVRAVWDAKREAAERELLAAVDVKPGTLLRHKSSGYVVRVLSEVSVWEPYGALVVDAEYVTQPERELTAGWVGRGEAYVAYMNEGEQTRRERGDIPRHPLWQYEAVIVDEAPAAVEQHPRRPATCTHGGDCTVHPNAQGLHNFDVAAAVLDLRAAASDPDPAGVLVWDLSVIRAAVTAWAPPGQPMRLDVERRLQRVEQRLQRARQADMDSDKQRLDDLAERLCLGIPESWDDDASIDSILVDYVRMIESRLLAAGGSLEKWAGDEDA
jgi:hypothetical protein